MHLRNLVPLLLVLALPATLQPANKEHEAIMREIQALSAEIQKLQKLNESVLELKLLLTQTLEMSTKTNSNVSVLERDMKERLREQEKTLVAPVAGLGSKLDAMADEFRYVKENINDLTSRISKLQTKATETDNFVRQLPTLIKPPEPPKPVEPDPATAAATPPQQAGGATVVPLEELYNGARRDLTAGRPDSAIKNFTDVIKYYPKSDLACSAQYNIGEAYFRQEKLEEAIVAFEAVDKYPEDCAKRPDALYMKGKAYFKGGAPSDAAKAYRALKTKHPQKEWIDKANAGLREAGFSTGATTPTGARRTKR